MGYGMNGEYMAPFDHPVSGCLTISVSVAERTLNSLTQKEDRVPRMTDHRALLSRS